MRLTELLDEYARLTLIGERTARLYRITIRHFSRTLLRHAEVDDFTEVNLARHAARRLQTGRAAATVAGDQCKLLALWRFAAKQGYIRQWPTMRPVKVPDRIPRAWTREELAKLLGSTSLAFPVGLVNGQLWWTALFLVLWDTGERIEATLALDWANVDLEGGSVMMPAETRKGGRTDRLYRIASDTAAILARLPRDRKPFAWPYHLSTLYNRLDRMLEKAGLPHDRRSKFHRIRRSTASHYEAAGGNATELLGHTSRKVTRTYLDPRVVKPPSAVDLLFRLGVTLPRPPEL